MKNILKIILFCLSYIQKTDAKLFILVGPSGVGKSTIIAKIIQQINANVLVTHTTRPIRPGEIHGKDYFFITKEEHEEKIMKDELLYPTEYCKNHYGICKKYIRSKLEHQDPLLCAINVDIAPQLQKLFMDISVSIFISPPSFEVLAQRLLQRKTENEEALQMRLKSAAQELQHQHNFDHIIINDNINEAVEQLKEIIKKRNLGIQINEDFSKTFRT